MSSKIEDDCGIVELGNCCDTVYGDHEIDCDWASPWNKTSLDKFDESLADYIDAFNFNVKDLCIVIDYQEKMLTMLYEILAQMMDQIVRLSSTSGRTQAEIDSVECKVKALCAEFVMIGNQSRLNNQLMFTGDDQSAKLDGVRYSLLGNTSDICVGNGDGNDWIQEQFDVRPSTLGLKGESDTVITADVTENGVTTPGTNLYFDFCDGLFNSKGTGTDATATKNSSALMQSFLNDEPSTSKFVEAWKNAINKAICKIATYLDCLRAARYIKCLRVKQFKIQVKALKDHQDNKRRHKGNK